jgi:hypothetical protein
LILGDAGIFDLNSKTLLSSLAPRRGSDWKEP